MGCVLTPPGLAPIAHLKPRIVSAEISCRGSPRAADAAACGTHVGHAADQPSPPVSPAQDARGGRGGSRLASPSTPRDTRLRDPPHPPPLGPIRNPPDRRRVSLMGLPVDRPTGTERALTRHPRHPIFRWPSSSPVGAKINFDSILSFLFHFVIRDSRVRLWCKQHWVFTSGRSRSGAFPVFSGRRGRGSGSCTVKLNRIFNSQSTVVSLCAYLRL